MKCNKELISLQLFIVSEITIKNIRKKLVHHHPLFPCLKVFILILTQKIFSLGKCNQQKAKIKESSHSKSDKKVYGKKVGEVRKSRGLKSKRKNNF